jgi:predicted deacylase
MTSFNFQHIRHTTIHGEKPGSHLLLLAGVHGDEYEPIAAASTLIHTVPEILKRGKVTIVPIVNLSAFRRASRTGEDGLDLARTCPGKKTGSVSEQVAAEVSELIADADYLIDLHTGGTVYEIDPLSGYVLHKSADVLEKQREMARAFNLKTIWGTSDKLNGRTLSVARDHNVPAIYAEFGGGGGFKKSIVKEYVQGCLNVINMLGMSDGSSATDRWQYEVEDHRDESGHLQRMLPAACDGFFEAEVSLGEFVKKQQQIGSISNPYNGKREPVHADVDGMVFLLRAVPSVLKGDALGGIIPVNKSGKVTIL